MIQKLHRSQAGNVIGGFATLNPPRFWFRFYFFCFVFLRYALCSMPLASLSVGGSSSGRTTDSDSVNRGSNPRPPANKHSIQLLFLASLHSLHPPCTHSPSHRHFYQENESGNILIPSAVGNHIARHPVDRLCLFPLPRGISTKV
jgi:hypothetical protein